MAHDPIPRTRTVRIGPARHVLRATHARGYIGTGAMCATCPRIDREHARCTLFAEPLELLDGFGARRLAECMMADDVTRAMIARREARRQAAAQQPRASGAVLDHPRVPRHDWERRIDLEQIDREEYDQ